MASKQLGKLRQWGREVISSKEKTVVTEEFKELEQDIDLRRAGIEKLHGACTEYHGYLHKKKEYPDVEEGVKMLPVDALGAVMMAHGDEFGDDSAFGHCLIKFGRAHCKIATLQETYALTFRDTYFANLEAALGELSDYTAQRKKLDSRRLAYDAAMAKASKAKKEKEVKEAEEELSKAKLRYEETSTDVQARMHAIQEKEIQQLRDLTEFLTTEVRYVEQYLDVLRDTQDGWLDESVIVQNNTPRPSSAPHAFSFGRSTPSISSTSKTSVSARPSSVAASTAGTSPSDEGDYNADQGFGVKRRASPANTPRPSSRASNTSTGTAHTSKRRRDSVGSEGGGSKRTGVAGWASSAVSSLSVSGRGKKDPKKDKASTKDKDKDASRAFASLENDGDESSEDDDRRTYDQGTAKDESLSRSFGSSSLSKVLSQAPLASLRPAPAPTSSSSGSSFNSFSGSASSETRRVVRALHDFSGSSEELSFLAGDEIVVLAESKGGWSHGELAGRRGLFPTNYVEEIVGSRSRAPPAPSHSMTSIAQRAQNASVSEDDASIISDIHDVNVYDEPFGDHHLAKSPMSEHERDATTDDEDEMKSLFPQRTSLSLPNDALATHSGLQVGNSAGKDVFSARPPPPALPQRKQEVRKPPPPPPPARRSTVSATSAPAHTALSGGSYVSAPSSTANLSAGTSFPLPPAAPKRMNPRARSTTTLPQPEAATFTSPFDN